jgi:hypothetical protein
VKGGFCCVHQPSVTVTKHLRWLTYKETRFILLTVLEVPWPFGCVALGLGRHSIMVKQTVHFTCRKPRLEEEAKVPLFQWPKDIPLGPASQKLTTFQWQKPGDQAFNIQAFGAQHSNNSRVDSFRLPGTGQPEGCTTTLLISKRLSNAFWCFGFHSTRDESGALCIRDKC